MKASVIFLLAVVFLALVLEFAEGTEEPDEKDKRFWGRRRRSHSRRRRYCRRQNCQVNNWSSWSGCQYGKQTRTRNIVRHLACGGSACPTQKEIKHCSYSPGVERFHLCEHQSGDIRCPSGRKISIVYANYGRTTGQAVCPHRAMRTTNCRSPTSNGKIRSACNGKNRCHLYAKNSVYGDPCHGTFKYIEVRYKCVSAQSSDDYFSTLGQWYKNMRWCINARNHQLLVGDFNGDGKSDMLCHNKRTGFKYVTLADGNGAFTQGTWRRNMGWCKHSGAQLFLGDFNGDGRTDMLCHDRNGYKWVALADAAGHFRGTDWQNNMHFCSHAGERLVIGDFNGDGRHDMLCSGPHRKQIAYAQSGGRFNRANVWTMPGNNNWCTHGGSVIHVGDVNGDKKDDLLCHDSNGWNWVMLATHSGQLSGRSDWKHGKWCTRAELHLGYFNGDQQMDRLCHRNKDGYKWISLATPNIPNLFTGTVWHKAMRWCTGKYGQLFVADFNGDGKSDLLCHHSNTGRKWIVYNRFSRGPRPVARFQLCEHQSGDIRCPSGRKISIVYANYGRTTGHAVCPHRAMRTTNCRSPTSNRKIRSACNGKNRCHLYAKNSVYGDPCHGTFKYIEIRYKCVSAQDGRWSRWRAWGRCTKSCGTGKRIRIRYCNSPSPAYGGRRCYGSNKQTGRCNTRSCPRHGRWSRWRAWGRCTKSCGTGKRIRIRYCNSPSPAYGGRRCYGSNEQTGRCNTRSCPRHGRWSKWRAWGRCTKSCGTGKRIRIRYCNSPSPAYGGRRCYGSNKQTGRCNTRSCPRHGRWSRWRAWGKCSKSCGTGKRIRIRYCNSPSPAYGGRRCYGSNKQTGRCNTRSCLRQSYTHEGCWTDVLHHRALPKLLLYKHQNSHDQIRTCAAKVARANQGYHGYHGYQCFGLQNGGECWAATDRASYRKYGHSHKCGYNGLGGALANDVYCFNTGAPTTKPSEVPTTGSPHNCFAEWSEWSKCSKGCGCGEMRRARYCKGGNACPVCHGAYEESRKCNCGKCPGQK